MSEERLQILRMLEQGKVSAEEAAKLLEAVEVTGEARGAVGDSGHRNRFLRVHIMEGNKTKVNVNLPLALARVALNFVPKDMLKDKGIDELVDLDQIVRMLEEGFEGKIVDVEDEDSNTRVEVRVE